MKKSFFHKNNDLENEVKDLQNRVGNYTLFPNDFPILKDIHEAKREQEAYRNEKKSLKRKQAVKNLCVTTRAFVLSLPIVIVCGSCILSSVYFASEDSYESYDIYVDNTGYQEYVDYDLESDVILVKTPWESKGDVATRSIYRAERSVAYEDREEYLEKDYLELLNEKKFKLVREEEKNIEDVDFDKNEATIGITTDLRGEKEELSNGFIILGGFTIGTIFSAIPALISWGLNKTVLENSLDNLEMKADRLRREIENSDIKAKKTKFKKR